MQLLLDRKKTKRQTQAMTYFMHKPMAIRILCPRGLVAMLCAVGVVM